MMMFLVFGFLVLLIAVFLVLAHREKYYKQVKAHHRHN